MLYRGHTVWSFCTWDQYISQTSLSYFVRPFHICFICHDSYFDLTNKANYHRNKTLWQTFGIIAQLVTNAVHHILNRTMIVLWFYVQNLFENSAKQNIYRQVPLLRGAPDSKVHVANMKSIWGRQDRGGPHVGPMNFAIWDNITWYGIHRCRANKSKLWESFFFR